MQTKPPMNMDRLKELIAHGEPWATAAFAIFYAFMLPVWPLLSVALFMVVADQITGRRAARKRGEAMSVAGKMRTVEKFFLYVFVILGAAFIDFVFFSLVPIPTGIVKNLFTIFISFQIAWTEYESIIKNVKAVTNVRIDINGIAKEKIKALFPGSEPDQKQDPGQPK